MHVRISQSAISGEYKQNITLSFDQTNSTFGKSNPFTSSWLPSSIFFLYPPYQPYYTVEALLTDTVVSGQLNLRPP